MPASTEAPIAPRGFDIDRSSFTIRLQRLVDAPAAAVFDAWTRPEEIAVWWDPSGTPLARCDIDLRLGGSFTFVPEGSQDMPFSGVYREIARPERLAFEAMGAIGRVSLQNAGGKTQMTVTITCRSAEHLDDYIRMRVDVGTAQTLDNLVAFAARQSA